MPIAAKAIRRMRASTEVNTYIGAFGRGSPLPERSSSALGRVSAGAGIRAQPLSSAAVSALRANALRRGRVPRAGERYSRCAVRARSVWARSRPAALAGQIVWSTSNGIWAMNDDGSEPARADLGALAAARAVAAAGTLAPARRLPERRHGQCCSSARRTRSPRARPAAGLRRRLLGDLRAARRRAHRARPGGGRLGRLGLLREPAAPHRRRPGAVRLVASDRHRQRDRVDAATALVERPLSAGASVDRVGRHRQRDRAGVGLRRRARPGRRDPGRLGRGAGLRLSRDATASPSCQYAVQFGSVDERRRRSGRHLRQRVRRARTPRDRRRSTSRATAPRC